MNFGERIAFIRKEKKLSAAAFGRLVGVTRAAVGIWLTQAECRIEPANLFRMESRTGFRARWIALGDGPMRVSDPDAVLTAEEEELLKIWRGTAYGSRDVALRMLRALPREPNSDDDPPLRSRPRRKLVHDA